MKRRTVVFGVIGALVLLVVLVGVSLACEPTPEPPPPPPPPPPDCAIADALAVARVMGWSHEMFNTNIENGQTIKGRVTIDLEAFSGAIAWGRDVPQRRQKLTVAIAHAFSSAFGGGKVTVSDSDGNVVWQESQSLWDSDQNIDVDVQWKKAASAFTTSYSEVSTQLVFDFAIQPPRGTDIYDGDVRGLAAAFAASMADAGCEYDRAFAIALDCFKGMFQFTTFKPRHQPVAHDVKIFGVDPQYWYTEEYYLDYGPDSKPYAFMPMPNYHRAAAGGDDPLVFSIASHGEELETVFIMRVMSQAAGVLQPAADSWYVISLDFREDRYISYHVDLRTMEVWYGHDRADVAGEVGVVTGIGVETMIAPIWWGGEKPVNPPTAVQLAEILVPMEKPVVFEIETSVNQPVLIAETTEVTDSGVAGLRLEATEESVSEWVAIDSTKMGAEITFGAKIKVESGMTYWELSEKLYGSGVQWEKIAELDETEGLNAGEWLQLPEAA